MIKQISNSTECLQALNENLYGLLSGTRKPPIVKEVNNTIGKMQNEIKMQLFTKDQMGDKTPLDWFAEPKKALTNG